MNLQNAQSSEVLSCSAALIELDVHVNMQLTYTQKQYSIYLVVETENYFLFLISVNDLNKWRSHQRY